MFLSELFQAISPGRTKTNFHYNLMGEKAKTFYANVESLEPQNVSDALIYALGAPESVQVIILLQIKTYCPSMSIIGYLNITS
jgi:NADP-dependent 3-hydroxy acid dehydrogenase YdfG